MPIKSGVAFVIILPRFIAASIHMSSSGPPIAIGDLDAVVDIRVVRCVSLPVAEYASAGHRRLVGDGAGQVVHLPGWALERSLKSGSGQAESRRRIAADGMKRAIGRSVEGFDIWLTLWVDNGERPLQVSAIRAGDLGRDIARRGLAWGYCGLRRVPVPPANEGAAAIRPSGALSQRDTKTNGSFSNVKSTHSFS
jgi:hypothetical protein